MVKTRGSGECTFDEKGYKKRAACVVFKDEKEDQVLLITSTHYAPDNNWWIVPGGSVEENESPICAADREVLEESGVRGQILRFVGQVVNEVKRTKTWLFAMIVKDELDQWDERTTIGRQRKWFSVDVARKLLYAYKPLQASYIDLARKRKGHVCSSLAEFCLNSCCHGFNQPANTPVIDSKQCIETSPLNNSHTESVATAS